MNLLLISLYRRQSLCRQRFFYDLQNPLELKSDEEIRRLYRFNRENLNTIICSLQGHKNWKPNSSRQCFEQNMCYIAISRNRKFSDNSCCYIFASSLFNFTLLFWSCLCSLLAIQFSHTNKFFSYKTSFLSVFSNAQYHWMHWLYACTNCQAVNLWWRVFQ